MNQVTSKNNPVPVSPTHAIAVSIIFFGFLPPRIHCFFGSPRPPPAFPFNSFIFLFSFLFLIFSLKPKYTLWMELDMKHTGRLWGLSPIFAKMPHVKSQKSPTKKQIPHPAQALR